MDNSAIPPLSDSTITYRDHDPSLLLQIPSPGEEDVDVGGTRRAEEGAESNPPTSTGHQFHHPYWNGRNSCENLATSKAFDDPLRHRSCLVGSRGNLVGTCERYHDASHALSSSIPPAGLKTDCNSYPSTLEAAKRWDRFANGSPRPYYINLNGNYRTSASASAITSPSAAARGTSAHPVEHSHANNPHNRCDLNPNTNESATNGNAQPTYAARILTAESRTDAAGNAYTSYVMQVEILSPPSLRSSTARTAATATAAATNATSASNASPSPRPNNSHHHSHRSNNNHENTTIAIIEHRYSEFHKLQNQLLANRIFLRAPFPKKHWAGNLNVNLNFNLNFNVHVPNDLGGLVGLPSKRGSNARGARRRHADDATYREGVVSLERGASDSFDDDDDDVVVDDVPCGRNVGVCPSDDSKSNSGRRTILTEKAARSRAEVIELRKIQLDMWLSELCLELNKGGAGRLGGDDSGSMMRKEEGDCSIDGTMVRGTEEATKEREVVDEDEWEDVSAASVPVGATAAADNNDKMTPPTLRQQVIEFLTVSSANRPPCDRYNPVDWDDIFNSQHHDPHRSNNPKLMQPQQQCKSHESRFGHNGSIHNQTNKRQSPTKIDKDAPGIQKILSNPLSTTLGSSIRAATYTLMNMCGMRPELATGKNHSKFSPFSSSSSSSALKSMNSSDRRIPLELLQRAKGLVFLTVAKMGFLISGRVGTGLIVSRLDSGGATQSRPRWSAPSAIGTVGVGWGALVGGDIATYLIVFTTRKAVAAFSSPTGTVNLGAELGIAVGPVGRGASGHVNTGGEDMSPASFAPAYAYVHSKGLFVGISIESSVVSVRRDVNSKFYGTEVDVEDLLAGRVERPRAAQPLYDALDWCLHVDRAKDYYLQFLGGSNVGNTEAKGSVGGGGYDVVEDDNDEDDYETADYLYGSNYGGNTQVFESMTYNGRNYGDASFHGGGCLSYSSCR